MRHVYFIGLLFISLLSFSQKKKGATPVNYFPPYNNWQQKTATELGLKQEAIDAAITAAIAGETKAPRNMEVNHYRTFGKEPFGEGIGPFAERGAPTGIIVYKGYIIGSWGEPLRCDMTHSVTKSFLSSVIGVAVEQGLIHSVNDTVAGYVPPIELF